MNVIKCTKCGLHYDVDKYSTCPHCNGSIDLKSEKVSDVEITKKSKRGFFGKKEKSQNDDFGSETIGIYSSGIYNREDFYDGSKKTQGDVVEDTDVSSDITEEEEAHVESTSEDVSEEPGSSSNNSLTEEIKNINKNNNGRTMGYFSFGNSDEETKSVSNEATRETSNVEAKPVPNKVQSAPVVGWLVCTKGNHLGESFQIYDGNNSIGRGDSNDMILFKEPSVSLNKHAIIIYEPEKRYFLIQSGDSHGLTYLNDDLVTIPQKINIYDSIRFGKSSFIFIPLCGEKFSWEEYIGR